MQNQPDPVARLCVFALAALVAVAFFVPGAQAEPTQAQQIIIIATPTLGIAQPTPAAPDQAPVVEVRAVVPAAPAPRAADVPAPAAAVTNEGSRPVEHPLSAAPQPIQLDPPQAVQPPAGAVLVQAHDGPGFAAALDGEGTKPSRAWKP